MSLTGSGQAIRIGLWVGTTNTRYHLRMTFPTSPVGESWSSQMESLIHSRFLSSQEEPIRFRGEDLREPRPKIGLRHRKVNRWWRAQT